MFAKSSITILGAAEAFIHNVYCINLVITSFAVDVLVINSIIGYVNLL